MFLLIGPPKRKGFMKSMEGILAAILLLGYTTSFLSLEPIDPEWERIHSEQQAQEYLSAMSDTPLRDLIIKNKKTEFLDITQHFLGSGKGYSLETENLVDYAIRATVLLNPVTDAVTRTPLGQTPCLGSERNCYRFSAPSGGGELWLVDSNADGREEYVAIHRADTGQGPFYRTDFVPLQNGEQWQIGEITYSGTTPTSVVFFNTARIFQIKNALEGDFRVVPFGINGRILDIRVIGSLINDTTLDDNDLVFLADNFVVNSASYTILSSLLANGINMIAFISPSTSLTPEFQNLTNGLVVTYQEKMPSTETTLANVSFESKAFEIPRYLSSIGFDVYTLPGSPRTMRLGTTTYTVGVSQSAGTTFDRFTIDADPPLSAGDSFTKDGNNYNVAYIHPDGYFVTIRPSQNHIFKNYEFPGKLVSLNEVEDEFLLYDRTGKYTADGSEAYNLVEGQTYKDVAPLNFGGNGYAVSLAPPTVTYDGITYPNNGTVQIGPDTYRVYIIDDEEVWWELIHRWRIPFAISNHDNKGTVFLVPLPDADDEWAYVRSATFQLLKGPSEIVRTTYGKRGSVSAIETFIETRDFYQVYQVIFRIWY